MTRLVPKTLNTRRSLGEAHSVKSIWSGKRIEMSIHIQMWEFSNHMRAMIFSLNYSNFLTSLSSGNAWLHLVEWTRVELVEEKLENKLMKRQNWISGNNFTGPFSVYPSLIN